MSTPSADPAERDEQPIVVHYVLVVLIEVIVISALAWMAAAFR